MRAIRPEAVIARMEMTFVIISSGGASLWLLPFTVELLRNVLLIVGRGSWTDYSLNVNGAIIHKQVNNASSSRFRGGGREGVCEDEISRITDNLQTPRSYFYFDNCQLTGDGESRWWNSRESRTRNCAAKFLEGNVLCFARLFREMRRRTKCENILIKIQACSGIIPQTEGHSLLSGSFTSTRDIHECHYHTSPRRGAEKYCTPKS